MKKDELQSRRDFFKNASKKVLPILGASIISALPLGANAQYFSSYTPLEPWGSNSCNGCSNGCSGGCSNGCSGSCRGGCSNGCQGTCVDACARSCADWCESNCRSTCEGACRGTCIWGNMN
ncbi:MAG: hypothetical protein II670_11470 [Alphaproteobacteria bacterium]|nr:hypothetical protein [Alphaproteobacteria bacterium]